jgi:DNA processing protein
VSEPTRQEFWASLCLKHSPGLGPRTSKKILEHFGSAAKAVDNAASWQGLGLVTSPQLQSFLAQSWLPQAQDELARADDKGIDVLLWSDPRYPERLREIPDPPVFLYTIGDLGLLNFPGVAVVGSRDCSRYGIELAHGIAMDLSAAGITVISGMAHGIDREAHLGGLSGPGGSIAVMGTGPDLIYPASNRDLWVELTKKGLVLSELAPGTKPLAGNFPKRNRIISGISLGVLVVEASTRSGSLITARLGMEQGREVFAMPGPVSLPSYRGCHEIINKGAKLVHGAEDILVEIKPQVEAFLAQQGLPRKAPSARPVSEQARLVPVSSPVRPPQARSRPGASTSKSGTPVSSSAGSARPAEAHSSSGSPTVAGEGASSPLEETVAGHLAALGATHIDSLCRVLGREAAEMSRTLVVLELKGVVRRLPGGYYLSA